MRNVFETFFIRHLLTKLIFLYCIFQTYTQMLCNKPVSYTHLDVYKRQTLLFGCPKLPLGWAPMLTPVCGSLTKIWFGSLTRHMVHLLYGQFPASKTQQHPKYLLSFSASKETIAASWESQLSNKNPHNHITQYL